MQINSTLLVQIGNFFIFYFLVRDLLCKPGNAVIEAEEALEQKLQQQLLTYGALINALEHQEKEQNSQFKQRIGVHVPPVEQFERELPLPPATVSVPSISSKEQEKLVHEVSQFIVDRMRNDSAR